MIAVVNSFGVGHDAINPQFYILLSVRRKKSEYSYITGYVSIDDSYVKDYIRLSMSNHERMSC